MSNPESRRSEVIGQPALAALKKIFPPDRLLTAAAEVTAFQSDGLTAFAAKPRAVVIPETQQEIIDAVRWCAAHQVPFVTRGSGTSLSGGSLPIAEGIVIALNRMNRILLVDPVERIATVEPGVINLDVSRAVESSRLYYAPDPSSQAICTIGGNVAFNSGGAHCLKYGMTSNHVLGVKAVMASGELVMMGGPSREQVGPDTLGLFCGSEGLFGAALEITLQLLPIPETYHTVLAGYESIEDAGHAVAAVIAAGLLPGAMEIMDALAIQAAEAAVHCDYPAGAAAILIVELEGPSLRIEQERRQLAQVLDETNPFEVRVAADDAQRQAIWKGRKSAFSAVGRLSPDFIVQDGVVPRTRLGEALRRIGELAKQYHLRVANVFHAGDGNLHPLILYDGRVPGQLQQAEQLAGQILMLCIEMGGSITGEHGVGMEKREFLPTMFDADTIAIMKRVRQAHDPHEIANRGKMFPGAEPPALSAHGLHPLEQAGIISRE